MNIGHGFKMQITFIINKGGKKTLFPQDWLADNSPSKFAQEPGDERIVFHRQEEGK